MESDDEIEEIIEERDAAPIRIRISGGRGRVGPTGTAIPAAIDPGCC